MVILLRTRGIWTGVPGAPAYSNLYWMAGIGDEQDASDMHAAFLLALEPHQALAVDWTMDSTAARIDSTTGDITGLQSVTPATGTGNETAVLLPRASQVLIHWRTGIFQNGREIRGRSFLPYFTEDGNAAGGIIEPATRAAVVAAAGAMIQVPSMPQLLVWSRTSGDAPAVTQATVNEEFATMRSRRD